MSPEGDFPPRRQLQPEVKVLLRRPRFERIVDVDPPKRKGLWRRYVAEINGQGFWLYKVNNTALYLTGMLFFVGTITMLASIAALIISGKAHAQERPTVEAIAPALSKEARALGYHVRFSRKNCQHGANYVCDIVATSGISRYRFLAAAPRDGAPIDHFSLPMTAGTSVSLVMVSHSVVSSLIGDTQSRVEDMVPFLQDAFQGARVNGGTITDPFRGTQQTITAVPNGGYLVQVGYQ